MADEFLTTSASLSETAPEVATEPEAEVMDAAFWTESLVPMFIVIAAFLAGPIVLCSQRAYKIRAMRKRQATLGRAKKKLRLIMAGDNFKSPKPKPTFKTTIKQTSTSSRDEAEPDVGGQVETEVEAQLGRGYNRPIPPTTPSQINLESGGTFGGNPSSLLVRIRQMKAHGHKDDSSSTSTVSDALSSRDVDLERNVNPECMVDTPNEKPATKQSASSGRTRILKTEYEGMSDYDKNPTSLSQRIKQLVRAEKENAKSKLGLDRKVLESKRPPEPQRSYEPQRTPESQRAPKSQSPLPKCADCSPFTRLMETVAKENAKGVINAANKPVKEFLTPYDRDAIRALPETLHGWRSLLYVAGPCMASLALCPLTLYLYGPLVDAFWWSVDPSLQELPNVNEAIYCFLMPAGVVYATSFGFAVDTAVAKQTSIMKKLCKVISQLDQILSLSSKLVGATAEQKCMLYTVVKNEAINLIQDIRNNKQRFEYKDSSWFALNMLRGLPARTERFNLDTLTADKIVLLLSRSKDAIDKKVYLHGRIHFMQWLFLELLGFISFFGILLTQTQSYRSDLLLCMLTVASISLLCYVVADLDSPFSGCFRIDVGVLVDLVRRAEAMWGREVEGEEVGGWGGGEMCGYPGYGMHGKEI